jgi:hypothetical protein
MNETYQKYKETIKASARRQRERIRAKRLEEKRQQEEEYKQKIIEEYKQQLINDLINKN